MILYFSKKLEHINEIFFGDQFTNFKIISCTVIFFIYQFGRTLFWFSNSTYVLIGQSNLNLQSYRAQIYNNLILCSILFLFWQENRIYKCKKWAYSKKGRPNSQQQQSKCKSRKWNVKKEEDISISALGSTTDSSHSLLC